MEELKEIDKGYISHIKKINEKFLYNFDMYFRGDASKAEYYKNYLSAIMNNHLDKFVKIKETLYFIYEIIRKTCLLDKKSEIQLKWNWTDIMDIIIVILIDDGFKIYTNDGFPKENEITDIIISCN